MELELSRVDYTIVGLTSSHCLKLLPSSGPKHQQKVAIADNDGVLQVFSIKKGDIQLHFKTLPGPEITAVHCGGPSGTVHDKIFISFENEIRGFSKKGKLFLSFGTTMTEPIKSMYVFENDLILCGKHVYNHYKDCKDAGSYLCGDSILDVVALPPDKNRRLTSIIACEGRMLRILEHARVISSIEVGSMPVVLHLYIYNDDKHVLFGTIDGRIGLLEIDRLQTSFRWLLDNNKSTSAISCIDSYDMTADTIPNLLVGRQDGNIEVYAVNISDPNEVPLLLYSYNCSESVTAIQGGVVGNQGYDEIIVTTYTGRVFGLTSEIIDKTIGADVNNGSYILTTDANQKIAKLKAEITELETKVARERDRYQLATQSLSNGVSAIPALPIKDTMILHDNDASYTLTLEVPAAIDNVLLQSDVPVDLLDVEKNSAVVSYSDCNPQEGNYLLVAYRCQVNTNRLEIKIRTIEGQYGKLQAYVTPAVQPKCCQLKYFDIKPLSLHTRTNEFTENKPYNILTLKGPFSLGEVHAWVSKCFPEVPEKPQVSEKTVLIFKSIFTGTVVQCSYCKGDAVFKGESISTISILKEFLTKEATKKKTKLEINCSVDDETIKNTLTLLDPKLQEYSAITKKILMLEALHELEINEEENYNYLSPKYKKLLAEEKDLKESDCANPSYLQRLHGIVTDLYVDYNKFKGNNVKTKIPQLMSVLENYEFKKLYEFFIPHSV